MGVDAQVEEISAHEDKYTFVPSAALIQANAQAPSAIDYGKTTAYGLIRDRRTGVVRAESTDNWFVKETNRHLRSLDPLTLADGTADWESVLPVFDGELGSYGRNPTAKFHVERISGEADKYLVTYRIDALAFHDATVRSGTVSMFGFGVFDHKRGLSEGFGLRYTARIVATDGNEATLEGEKLVKRSDSALLFSQLGSAAIGPSGISFAPTLPMPVDLSSDSRLQESPPAWMHSTTQIVGLVDTYALGAGERQTNPLWLVAIGAFKAVDDLTTGIVNFTGTLTGNQGLREWDGVSGVIQNATNAVLGETVGGALGTVVSLGLSTVNFAGGLKVVGTVAEAAQDVAMLGRTSVGIGAAVEAKLQRLKNIKIWNDGEAAVLGRGAANIVSDLYVRTSPSVRTLIDSTFDLIVDYRKEVEAIQQQWKLLPTWIDQVGLANLIGKLAGPAGDLRDFGADFIEGLLDRGSPSVLDEIYSPTTQVAEQQALAQAAPETFVVTPLNYGPLPDWLSERLYPDWHTLPFVKQLLARIAERSAGGDTLPDTPAPPTNPWLSDYLIPPESISFSPSFWSNFGTAHSLIGAWSVGDQANVTRSWKNDWELINFVPQGGTTLAGGMYWGTMDAPYSDNRRFAVGFGSLPTALPATGSASYTWVGGTLPVDHLGRTGSITNPGSLSVNFATGQFTYSGLAYSIAGVNYAFGQATFRTGTTILNMYGQERYVPALEIAPIAVNVSGASTCSPGCSGFVSGILLGAEGTGAAITSAVIGTKYFPEAPPPGTDTRIGASTVQVYAQ